MTDLTEEGEERFHGHGCPECEHRTVGAHRAWCHTCREWCYPESPCVRCERWLVWRKYGSAEPVSDTLLSIELRRTRYLFWWQFAVRRSRGGIRLYGLGLGVAIGWGDE